MRIGGEKVPLPGGGSCPLPMPLPARPSCPLPSPLTLPESCRTGPGGALTKGDGFAVRPDPAAGCTAQTSSPESLSGLFTSR